jgi:hypothetical protein
VIKQWHKRDKRARLAIAFATVCAFGFGSTAGASAAIPAPTTKHVQTWAYDDGCTGGHHASGALVRGWLTIAETSCGPRDKKARDNCHFRGRAYCAVVQYLDTNWSFNRQVPTFRKANGSNWWLHQPKNAAARIYTNTFTGGWAINQSNPSVRAYFRRYELKNYNSDDGLMMDWQVPSMQQSFYFSDCPCSSSYEVRTNAAFRKFHQEMAADMTHRDGVPMMQIDNSLPWTPFTPQGMTQLDSRIGVDGWSEEGAPEDFGAIDPFYSTLLDQIAYISNNTGGFIALWSKGYAGARTQMRSRMVTEATMLLGFTPTHIVDWPDLERGSRDLAVWPEEGIYPQDPVETMAAPSGRACLAGTGKVCSVGGHNSIEVARGVYRREFSDCSDRGHQFGVCAAIVNTTGHSVRVKARWLRQSYSHEITLTGGDVQRHGSVRLHGAGFSAGHSQVPRDSALLLAS